MEILERYLYAVGRWLPFKQKKDILAELESSIYDSLESGFGKKDSYTDEEVSQVITELGSPWKVAASYSGLTDRLIGPELLPLYMTLSLVISGAVAIGLTVSFVVSMFRPDLRFVDFLLGFGQLLIQIVTSSAMVIGFTTIVFAIIDHMVPDSKLKSETTFKKGVIKISLDGLDPDDKKANTWTPDDLPVVPKGKSRIPRWEPIVGIVFSIIAIVLFNFFRDVIGIYYTTTLGSGWNFVPILSEEAVKVYLPFWNLVWGIGILFCVYQLVKGRWTLPMRIIDVFRSLLDAAVISIMIRGPELIDMRLLLSHVKPETAEGLRHIAEWFDYSIDKFLIFALVLTCLGILGKIVNLFRRDSYFKS